MHVIIAGTARAGKTTLSLMLNKDGYTHYKMDSVKRGVCEAYGLNYTDWQDVSPIICTIINRIIQDNKTDTNYLKEKYLFDTPFIYPKDINLIDTKDTVVIFIGYAHTTPKEVFKNIRKYDADNLWTKKLTDDILLKECQENIEFSKLLENECKKHSIKYFDTSKNREEVLIEAKKYIETNSLPTPLTLDDR